MITDCQTDRVFISSELSACYAQVAAGLREALGPKLKTIYGAKDVWARDYMPIQIDTGQFVQFRFHPNYLEGRPKERTTDGAALVALTGGQGHNASCRCCNLVIDGGNVVRWSDAVIMTDKIYRENGSIPRQLLRRRLQSVLRLNRLIVIPREPYDLFGHADGMVRFADDRTVLVNHPVNEDRLGRELRPHYVKVARVIRQHGFTPIEFPYQPREERNADGIPSAKGVYINFLQTADMIVFPTFGWPDADGRAQRVLRQTFPRYRIIPLDCNDLAVDGGLLNCVTWNVKGPLR